MEFKKEKCSPAPGEEQPKAPVHAGGCSAGKSLTKKNLWGPGEHQVEHQPPMCSCCKEDEWDPCLL